MAGQKNRAATREIMQPFILRLPTEIHTQLRHLAIDAHVSMNTLVVEQMIRPWLVTHSPVAAPPTVAAGTRRKEPVTRRLGMSGTRTPAEPGNAEIGVNGTLPILPKMARAKAKKPAQSSSRTPSPAPVVLPKLVQVEPMHPVVGEMTAFRHAQRLSVPNAATSTGAYGFSLSILAWEEIEYGRRHPTTDEVATIRRMIATVNSPDYSLLGP